MLKEFTNGVKIMFQEFFNKKTNIKQRANMWTFSRLVLAFLIPFTALIGKLLVNPIGYFGAAGLTILGTITDFMDGKSARKHNSISTFGKKLDILADKVFAFMLGISLSLINPLFLFNILGEAMISYTNIHYQKKHNHVVPKSSYIGKVKQWPLSIAFILGYLSIFLPQLTLITDIFVFISFMMELLVFKNYVNINNYHADSVNETNNCKNADEDIFISKEKTLKDEYLNLRNVLVEIEKIKNNDLQIENVKIKKR